MKKELHIYIVENENDSFLDSIQNLNLKKNDLDNLSNIDKFLRKRTPSHEGLEKIILCDHYDCGYDSIAVLRIIDHKRH
ncbi:MAG: hypothetical protein COA79_01470 [Planctomycetota bacterium]|nr:MAG: hypothetical protein COA79_01470 [Planctomycetota bacterium]